MAARKQASPPSSVVEEELDPDDVDDDAGNEDDVDLIVEQLTGEAEYIVLWRADGPTAKTEHVDKVPLSRFNSDYVRERHGGGDYLFRAYGTKGPRGRRGVKKYKEFSIDKSIPPKTGSAAAAWNEKHPAAIGAATGPVARSGLPEWVSTMLAATVPALATGLVAMMTREKTVDPLLIELIKANNGGSGKGIDPIALQTLLADERARSIELGKEIAGGKGKRGGGDDDDDGMWGAVSEGISTLKEFALGYRQHAENEAKGITPAIPEDGTRGAIGDGDRGADDVSVADDDRAVAHVGPGAEAAIATRAGGAMRPWVAAASPYMGLLKLAKGMKPSTAAQVISDGLDDDAFNDLMADVEDTSNGGVLVRLPQYFPSLENANVEWVRAVIDELIATAVPLEDPRPEESRAETEDRTPGNTPTRDAAAG